MDADEKQKCPRGDIDRLCQVCCSIKHDALNDRIAELEAERDKYKAALLTIKQRLEEMQAEHESQAENRLVPLFWLREIDESLNEPSNRHLKT
jgi:sulfatase maturation enzyme AslB (radical SAM superfamily)